MKPTGLRPCADLKHGDRYVWINPPAIPLTTPEMDSIFTLPYQRVPHPSYGQDRIPAYDMIRFSVNIMRGCYGGCSFCSITERRRAHHPEPFGRFDRSRNREIRDKVPGFTGVISDLGGPTAQHVYAALHQPARRADLRRASCVYPEICTYVDTNHEPTIKLYRPRVRWRASRRS